MNSKKIVEKLQKIKNDSIPSLIVKDIKINSFKHVYIITDETVSSTDKVNNFILKFFSKRKTISIKTIHNLKSEIENYIPAINSKELTQEKDILTYVFNGYTVVLTDKICLAFETRAEIDRGVQEPTSEPVVRGAKDSFTENYNKNIGLLRKRLKSEHFTCRELTIGKDLKNKVCMLYVDNICQDELVEKVYNELTDIEISGLMDTNYIRELFKKENKTIFPTIISTEKPDDVTRNLIGGKIAIMMENSPTALIVPTVFIDFFQNSEDYNQSPFFASFVRIVRCIAFFLSILIPAFYLSLITYDQEILPMSLLINFAAQRTNVPFPALIEALILMFTFELLYEGDARTPNGRGTSLSILGALVLGDAAVKAGLISPIMVIVIAVSAISSLLFVFYDLQGTIRFWRYFLMILSSFFGIIGFFVGLTLMIINMCSIESFGKPYLLAYPPFSKNKSKDGIIRKSLSNMKYKEIYLTRKEDS